MQNYSILLVDDDPIILKATCRDFENRGYRVATADSGEKAFELLSKDTFDLVITDLHMEPIDGIDVLKKSKEINPDVMVMILTGYGDMASAIDTFRLGVDDYLAKPCSLEEIQYRVEKCLEHLENKRKIKRAEKALRESEEKYRNLVNLIPDPIVIAQEDRYLLVNLAFTEVFGISQQDVDRGLKSYDFVPKKDAEALRQRYEDRLAGKSISKYERVELINKDGKTIPCETSAILVQYNGRPADFIIIRDISERIRTEEAVKKSEERWRSLVENAPNIIIILDRDGSILFVNRPTPPLTREEAVGTNLYDYIGLEYRDLVREKIEQVYDTGEPGSYSIKGVGPNNSLRWYETQLGSIKRGGQVVAVTLITTDVTPRIKAEKALRDSESKYRDLVETAYDVIWEIDSAGNYTYISPNICNILGYTPEELLGKPMYELISPDEAAQLNDKLLTRNNFSEPVVSVEVTVMHKNGYPLIVESNSKPIFNAEGTLIGYRGIGRDITEKRVLEAEALQVGHLAALGELAAGVAHEINNPINGVINYAEILKDEFEEQGQDADIPNRIIKEGDRIAQIVRNLLSLARDRKESYGPAHIKDILSDTLSLVEKQTINDGILLSIADLSDLPNIEARPQEIQQVFLNIFSNARYALNQKFASSHEDKLIEISGEPIEIKGRGYIRTTFYDRGEGISAEILDKICNPFFSTKPKDKGTGLGLSISHGIVKNHDGRLLFESVEGEYTKVTVDLPVWKATETESESAAV